MTSSLPQQSFPDPFASIEDIKKAIDNSNAQRLVAENSKRSINETILRKIIRNTINEYLGFNKK